jgi:hypothetical protein
VVGVEVGGDHVAYVVRQEAQDLELIADLVFRRDPLTHQVPVEGVPAGPVATLRCARRLAGINEDEALGVFDQVGVDGERFGPIPVADEVEKGIATPSCDLDGLH